MLSFPGVLALRARWLWEHVGCMYDKRALLPLIHFNQERGGTRRKRSPSFSLHHCNGWTPSKRSEGAHGKGGNRIYSCNWRAPNMLCCGVCALILCVCVFLSPNRWAKAASWKCSEYEGQNRGFVGEARRKRGIPLLGQIFTSPGHWSVSDQSFVFHKAGHSSKAAIKSRTSSPIILLNWAPTPNPADVPRSAFAFAHFHPVQLCKNIQEFTNTPTSVLTLSCWKKCNFMWQSFSVFVCVNPPAEILTACRI